MKKLKLLLAAVMLSMCGAAAAEPIYPEYYPVHDQNGQVVGCLGGTFVDYGSMGGYAEYPVQQLADGQSVTFGPYITVSCYGGWVYAYTPNNGYFMPSY
jgi:hypothetical protein